MKQIEERVCFLHVGTHKTGTTSIQAFLAANRQALLAKGLFIPAAGGNGEPEFACHHGIVRDLLGNARFPGDLNCLDAVAAELRMTTAPLSCLSSEDFSLLYDRPAVLIRLRDVLRATGFAPKIIVYARPQASYSVAIYATNVGSGYRVPFSGFLDDVFEHGCYVWDAGHGPPFDYVRLLDAFAAVFGRDAIIVRPFKSDAPDRALLDSFMRIVLPQIDDLSAFNIPLQRANRTLTFSSVLRLLGIDNAIDEHVRFAPLTLAQLARVWSRFRASNRELAQRFGVRIPVLEPVDVLRALPVRRTPAMTRQLLAARRALASDVRAH